MLIATDLHIKTDSESVVFDEVLPGLLKAAVKRGESEIALLGDLYTIRYAVSVGLQNRLNSWVRQCQRRGIRLHILVGNHDQVNVQGRHALEVFNAWDHVTVYTDPTWNEHGFWMPYRKHHEDILAAFRAPKPAAGCPDVCFAHLGFEGALMNNTRTDKDGVPLGALNRFQIVFSGHYHKRQTLHDGRLVYVGTPYQTRADEAGQKKGYGVWDGSTFKWVTTQWGKRYHYLDVTEAIPTEQLRPGDEIRAKVPAGMDTSEVMELIKAAGATAILTPEVEAVDTRLDVEDDATLYDYADAYARLHAREGTITSLMETFQELTQ